MAYSIYCQFRKEVEPLVRQNLAQLPIVGQLWLIKQPYCMTVIDDCMFVYIKPENRKDPEQCIKDFFTELTFLKDYIIEISEDSDNTTKLLTHHGFDHLTLYAKD